jgi:1,2-dihydroxy-3-keto-5-methylthiopentene dioxygenase
LIQGDQRLPHDSGQSVGLDDLEKVGVLYHQIDEISGVDILAKQRGYKNRDQIVVSPENLGESYESKVQSFFAEHLHEDEEIRYVLDGSGFFDVRNKTDDWIRIYLTKVTKM